MEQKRHAAQQHEYVGGLQRHRAKHRLHYAEGQLRRRQHEADPGVVHAAAGGHGAPHQTVVGADAAAQRVHQTDGQHHQKYR